MLFRREVIAHSTMKHSGGIGHRFSLLLVRQARSTGHNSIAISVLENLSSKVRKFCRPSSESCEFLGQT